MRVVFVFDRDFTVSTGGGVIPIELVRMLKDRYPVYAYGNVALVMEAGVPYAEGDVKWRRILWVARRHPDVDEIVVVDDVRPNIEALPRFVRDKVKYYTPDRFMKVVNKYL